MAVWHGPRSERSAYRCTGTRTVIDDHLLAPCFGQLLREQTPKRIVAAAGWIRDDHPDRLGGIALGRRCARHQDRKRGESQREYASIHLSFSSSWLRRTAAAYFVSADRAFLPMRERLLPKTERSLLPVILHHGITRSRRKCANRSRNIWPVSRQSAKPLCLSFSVSDIMS